MFAIYLRIELQIVKCQLNFQKYLKKFTKTANKLEDDNRKYSQYSTNSTELPEYENLEVTSASQCKKLKYFIDTSKIPSDPHD